MQRALDHAGLGRRGELGPGKIDLEKLVGDDEPAARVAVAEMMAAREPEVLHLRCSRARPTRSTVSPGSSSLSTSMKAKARSGFSPWRGRKVRNVSRVAPLSRAPC